MKLAKHLIIHGRVQGVGYRYSMAEQATVLNITGWVRNRREGTVEAMVSGSHLSVESMLAWARRGPQGSKVTDVVVKDATGEFAAFEVLATA
jgi:acylphosphatase